MLPGESNQWKADGQYSGTTVDCGKNTCNPSLGGVLWRQLRRKGGYIRPGSLLTTKEQDEVSFFIQQKIKRSVSLQHRSLYERQTQESELGSRILGLGQKIDIWRKRGAWKEHHKALFDLDTFFFFFFFSWGQSIPYICPVSLCGLFQGINFAAHKTTPESFANNSGWPAVLFQTNIPRLP